MTRNLKVLGLTLVAALAMSAMAASAAQASNGFKVTADTYPAHVDATQAVPHIFTVAGGRTVTCNTATFTSESIPTGGKSTVTFTPTYAGCHSKLGATVIPATVNMGGCDYLLRATAHPETHKFTGTADLVCSTPNDVVINVYNEALEGAKHEAGNILCAYTVQHQAGLSAITFTNQTNGAGTTDDDIVLDINVAGVKYTRTAGETTNCGGANPAAGASLVGTATGTGTNEAGEANGIRVATEP